MVSFDALLAIFYDKILQIPHMCTLIIIKSSRSKVYDLKCDVVM